MSRAGAARFDVAGQGTGAVIGSLRGLLADKLPARALIETAGVGYEVELPMSSWLGLPAIGATVHLKIHHVVREDASLLYGFASESERALFRALLKVSGVGPKLALAVLSGVSVEAFATAVTTQDVAGLTRIPGVGRKTAERLVVELADLFRKQQSQSNGLLGVNVVPATREALEALITLGYKPAEAQTLLGEGAQPGDSTETLLRAALQRASQR